MISIFSTNMVTRFKLLNATIKSDDEWTKTKVTQQRKPKTHFQRRHSLVMRIIAYAQEGFILQK